MTDQEAREKTAQDTARLRAIIAIASYERDQLIAKINALADEWDGRREYCERCFADGDLCAERSVSALRECARRLRGLVSGDNQ